MRDVHSREKANLAITLTNGEPAGQVVAHAALYDYPNISEIDPTTWEVWLTTNYDVTMPTVGHTRTYYTVAIMTTTGDEQSISSPVCQ